MKSHPMVYEGIDKWLFLTGDSNNIVDQITGKYDLSIDFLEKWKNLLNFRSEKAKELGYCYLFSVAPNKECIYSNFLPENIKFSETRPIQKIIEIDERFQIFYMYDALKCYGAEPVYSKVDTHWNSFGSIQAFNALINRIGMDPIASDRFNRVVIQISGDLGSKIGRTEATAKYMLKPPFGHPIENNKIKNIGSKIVFEGVNKSHPRCVVFHDSFTLSQMFLFAERFSRIVYVWQPNIDYSVIKEERPDFVFSQHVERFLVEVPDDWGGLNQMQNEKIKRSFLEKDSQ